MKNVWVKTKFCNSPFFILDSVIKNGETLYIGHYEGRFKDKNKNIYSLVHLVPADNIGCIIHDYKPKTIIYYSEKRTKE